MSVPRIVIAGDLYPGVLSSPLLQAGDAGAVFGDLMPDLQRADLRIVNLEGPLVSRPDPLPKIGPHHAIDEKCIRGLKAAGFDVLNVGNNHSMDQGESGLRNTLKSIGDAGLAAVGGGENLNAAGEVLVRRVGDVRVGILSYTEHEFGIASASRPGTNPLDLVHFIRTVECGRDAWDYLIVLLHGGNEYYPYPRPQLREWCRLMLEQGARAVVLQHSHCPGCIEEHAGGYIVHGQGNFVFDERSARPCEQEGFLVILDIPDPARHALVDVLALGPRLPKNNSDCVFCEDQVAQNAALSLGEGRRPAAAALRFSLPARVGRPLAIPVAIDVDAVGVQAAAVVSRSHGRVG